MAGSDFVHRAMGEEFQRDVAGEHLVTRAVDNTHAAFANFRKDSVVIESFSDHGCGQTAMLPRSGTSPGLELDQEAGEWRAGLLFPGGAYSGTFFDAQSLRLNQGRRVRADHLEPFPFSPEANQFKWRAKRRGGNFVNK